jgi:two-component system, LytTR family, response regulator
MICNIPNLHFSKSVYNGLEALEVLKTQSFDIVFLDIEMPIINGIELLSTLQPKPAIVLCTAYTDFAFEAFQQEAVDYIQKPVSFLRFSKAVEKAIIYCEQKKLAKNTVQTIAVKYNGQIVNVLLTEVEYFASLGNYIKIIFHNIATKPLVIYETLSNLLNQLSGSNFIQIHRSYIINKSYLHSKEVEKITMSNMHVLPLGRKYKILLEK